MPPLKDRWFDFFVGSAGWGDPSALWNVIEENYGEPNRAYHNLDHIARMIEEFDTVREQIQDPLAIEWAIWFHDIYYQLGNPDNEARSAELASRAAIASGMSQAFADKVRSAIMATKTHASQDRDEQFLITLDLATLGGSSAEFRRYDAAICREARSFTAYTDELYRKGRLAWAEEFVKRAPIFPTEYGRLKYEMRAKANLGEMIENLRAGHLPC